MVNSLYQVSLEVPRDVGNVFAECIEAFVDSVSWTVQEGLPKVAVLGFSGELPNEDAIHLVVRRTAEAIGLVIPKVKISQIPIRNWVLDNIKQFPPIAVGRFFIHSAVYNDPIPYSKIGLRVPAGAAFGSGDHGSTKGCLLALDKMSHLSFRSVLDMGCGSGILAIAAAKRWHIPVIATDIDPISTKVTQENAGINGVARYVRSLCGVGYNHPVVAARRYDLIISNILARPLCRLAKDLGHYLQPGGWAVLSGLLLRDANRVITAHAAQGLHFHSRVVLGEWGTLVFRKPI
jgi:ribosomal protein L11 methyltransferase